MRLEEDEEGPVLPFLLFLEESYFFSSIVSSGSRLPLSLSSILILSRRAAATRPPTGEEGGGRNNINYSPVGAGEQEADDDLLRSPEREINNIASFFPREKKKK